MARGNQICFGATLDLDLWWCGVDVGIIYIYNRPVGNPKRRL
jgi:hypothetical protein